MAKNMKEKSTSMTCAAYGPTVLRVFTGVLFVVPGLMKLMNPSMIIGMLGQMGWPLATVFGWIVILSEVLCGLAVIAGFKLKYTVWPLVVIMLVATFGVYVPMLGADPTAIGSVLFHLLALAALVNLYLTGPGALGVDKK